MSQCETVNPTTDPKLEPPVIPYFGAISLASVCGAGSCTVPDFVPTRTELRILAESYLRRQDNLEQLKQCLYEECKPFCSDGRSELAYLDCRLEAITFFLGETAMDDIHVNMILESCYEERRAAPTVVDVLRGCQLPENRARQALARWEKAHGVKLNGGRADDNRDFPL
jgi:hypothetical protein